MATVIGTGVGSGRFEASRVTTTEPAISVKGNWGVAGMNSATVPITNSRFPTAAAPGGVPPVRITKIPSEVAGFPSAVSICMKNPLLRTA